MTHDFADICWPGARLGEAMEALARHTGLAPKNITAETMYSAPDGAERLARWLDAAASRLGLEVEPVEISYAEVEQLLQQASPALLRLPVNGAAHFLALAGCKKAGLAVLTPNETLVTVPPETIRAALCRKVEAPVAEEVQLIVERAGIDMQRRSRASAALRRQLLAGERVGGCWLLRCGPGSDLLTLAREARLPRLLTGLLGAHTLEYVLWLLSWWLLGWMAFNDRFETGWLWAWSLLLLAIVPCRLVGTSLGGSLAIQAGMVIKRRLLYGALKLAPDKVRHLGAGELLGRVIESEAVESMAISGGFLGLTALIELALAGFVLGAGAGRWLHVLGLVVWLVGAALVGRHYYRRRRAWTTPRLVMTNDLVEKMVGHRTRLAQQPRSEWHTGEDQTLERYLSMSSEMDRTGLQLQALLPRVWFIVGLLGLVPAFLAGRHSAAALAVGVGGVVLAYRAARNLVEGLEHLAGAAIAWERIDMLWQAAAAPEQIGLHDLKGREVNQDMAAASADEAPVILQARELVFRYPQRAAPILCGVNVSIRAGERLLLEGPSGGGKSTLAALLAGARVADSGLLLLHGLDRQTLGLPGWRQRVVIAPQFHDNHILMGTLAFNVLMGKRWPPQPGDLEEAERVCRALDLGPLLDRMPSGMLQMIGETGWQLSQGEKSRLYIARVLLQDADIMILDESFAALDPRTLQTTLEAVLSRAKTLLVIAHP